MMHVRMNECVCCPLRFQGQMSDLPLSVCMMPQFGRGSTMAQIYIVTLP